MVTAPAHSNGVQGAGVAVRTFSVASFTIHLHRAEEWGHAHEQSGHPTPEHALHLELSVATPVKDGDPTALMTRYGRVLIDESIRRAIQSTPEDWGRLLVLRLERGVRDQQVRTVHVQPMTIGGDEGQGEELEGFLRSWLGSALVESRLFRLVDPPPGVAVETDGKLYVESALRAGHVEVSLLVSDSNTWQRVTFAKVEMDRKLFPPGITSVPTIILIKSIG